MPGQGMGSGKGGGRGQGGSGQGRGNGWRWQGEGVAPPWGPVEIASALTAAQRPLTNVGNPVLKSSVPIAGPT